MPAEPVDFGDLGEGDAETLREEMRARDEVSFDIDASSSKVREEAYTLLAVMYKRHFLLLFVAGVFTSILLYVAFVLFGSVTWGSEGAPLRALAINIGSLAFPVATFALLPLLDRVVYARDAWSLERLGIDGTRTPAAKRSLVAFLFPLPVLLAIVPATPLAPQFSNPLWFAFIAGGIVVVVFEEILFRGVYWKYGIMRFGRRSMHLVHLVNAAVFAAIHLPSLFVFYVDSLLLGTVLTLVPNIGIMLASYFLSGLILGVLRDAFNHLVAPIAYHVTFNVLVFTFTQSVLVLLVELGILVALLVAWRAGVLGTRPVLGDAVPASPDVKGDIRQAGLHRRFVPVYYISCVLVAIYYASQAFTGNPGGMFLAALVAALAGAVAWFPVKRLGRGAA